MTSHTIGKSAVTDHAVPAPLDAPGQGQTVLRVDRLGKIFGDQNPSAVAHTGPDVGTEKSPDGNSVVAAWDVRVDVAAGGAFGVMGECGSGKSAVLPAIAGDNYVTPGPVGRRASEASTG